MKKRYHSHSYIQLLCVFGGLIILFVGITVYRWVRPEEFTGSKIIQVTYDYGTYSRTKEVKVGLLEEPNKPTYMDGYAFEGWFYTPEEGEAYQWDFDKYEATSEMTLKARWRAIPYILTLNANGGECSKQSVTYYVDQPFQLPTPTRKGYYFAGWYAAHSENYWGNKIKGNIWNLSFENHTLTARWTTYPPGMTVLYGRFEQDNDLENGTEVIEWNVLDYQDGKYFIVSKNILKNREWEKVNDWKTSLLRTWLNEDFYRSSFTADERKWIVETDLEDVGSIDKIFILNDSEADLLFLEEADCYGILTPYALHHGADFERRLTSEAAPNSYNWSVRDPGTLFKCKVERRSSGGGNTCIGDGIRPAMWVSEEAFAELTVE